MNYEVHLARDATKTLDRVDSTTRERLEQRLDQLGEDPFASPGTKPLTGTAGLWSSRVGGWRIIYSVLRDRLVVHVIDIKPRGQAYRRLG